MTLHFSIPNAGVWLLMEIPARNEYISPQHEAASNGTECFTILGARD